MQILLGHTGPSLCAEALQELMEPLRNRILSIVCSLLLVQTVSNTAVHPNIRSANICNLRLNEPEVSVEGSLKLHEGERKRESSRRAEEETR